MELSIGRRVYRRGFAGQVGVVFTVWIVNPER